MSEHPETPETDAFMILIDDSEIDLGLVESKLRDMERARDAARRCVGFFASVIKSGEAWSGTCEKELNAAMGRAEA